jgi:hypothetical protein
LAGDVAGHAGRLGLPLAIVKRIEVGAAVAIPSPSTSLADRPGMGDAAKALDAARRMSRGSERSLFLNIRFPFIE